VKTFIVVFVVLSLLGSVMWMMPTPREKFLAKLRLKAKAEGFHVQLVRLTAPRAQGEMEEQNMNIAAYRLPRNNTNKKLTGSLQPWQIFRLQAIANEGLPEGWCWKQGERVLNEKQLSILHKVIAMLPKEVVALESTPVTVTAYWKEQGEEQLAVIKEALNELLKENV
jgi:Na+-transporting methylmalonyl-CoA/oxaloacetate decarboxylase gamma subunit